MYAAIIACPLVIRLILMMERQVTPGLPDAIGVLSDTSAGILVILLVAVLLHCSKVLAALAAGGWLIVNIAAREYIAFFDSPYALAHVSYLFDKTFFLGSVQYIQHALAWIAALLVLVWLVILATKPGPAVLCPLLVAFLAVSGLNVFVERVPGKQEWRQRNFAYANLFPDVTWLDSRETEVDIPGTISERFIAEPQALFDPDLTGRRWLDSNRGRPNVLLVILEGISGGHIPVIADHHGIEAEERLGNLNELARRGVYASSFVAQQRQTDRGLYALLCGDYPKLLVGKPRMEEYIGFNKRICLPEILRDNDYRTIYLQAAPLPFMMKDQFMPLAGFEESRGKKYFRHGYAQTEWGVDDRAFLEQSLELLGELRMGKSPWFLTLLTSGAHHPFSVPHEFRPEQVRDKRQRALLWLDEAIGVFIDKLDAAGVLDDTLVIITSDESSGITAPIEDTALRLSQNWGFMIALTPEQERRHLRQPILQSDLALSVLDYLGLSESTHFAGRSFWRIYPDNRPVVFGNVYFRETSLLIKQNQILTCKETNRDCALSTIHQGAREVTTQLVASSSEAVRFLKTVAHQSALPWKESK
ncbi:MAG: hypothetical protein CMK32_12700 [Porticoccaceae bacterium]|nr:hypothetical protein [Porticoccaceae bacterium]